jgi:hypothetical protein
VVNEDHVSLSFERQCNYNPVYLRNAMVDLLTRPKESKVTTSTDVEVRTEPQTAMEQRVAARVAKFVPVEANIDHLASHHKALIKARADLKQLKGYIDMLEEKIKDELTKLGATDGKIKNAVVVTYRPKDAYRFAEFREAHPEIYDRYVTKVEVDKLDERALLAEHSGLLADFRSRAFNVK